MYIIVSNIYIYIFNFAKTERGGGLQPGSKYSSSASFTKNGLLVTFMSSIEYQTKYELHVQKSTLPNT